MSITRRKFLRAGIVTTIFAAVTGKFAGAAFGQRKSKSADLIAYYDKAAFAAYVNSDFCFHLEGRRAKYLRLVKVEDFPVKEWRPNSECFRLAFTAPCGTRLAQETYQVEHAALGTFALFIAPIGIWAGADEHYEAVFNRRGLAKAGIMLPAASNPDEGRGRETFTPLRDVVTPQIQKRTLSGILKPILQ